MVDISGVINITTIGEAVKYSNDVTSGNTIGVIVILIFSVLNLYFLRTHNSGVSLLVSSFIGFVLSSFLFWGGFVNFMFPLMFGVIVAGLIALSYWDGQ